MGTRLSSVEVKDRLADVSFALFSELCYDWLEDVLIVDYLGYKVSFRDLMPGVELTASSYRC